jgi:two-component system chemotaxis response regulator CheB
MPPVRVLIVDDSITMRALFSGVLEEAPGIQVIDHAANAAEARDLIARLHPDVVTLDVEMPGTSGIELLREIMADKPLPIIMLSTLTQKGSTATLEALELGAYDCFPKPKAATMEEFRKIGPKLAKIVKAAAAGAATKASHANEGSLVPPEYRPPAGVVVLVGNTGSVEMVTSIVNRLPANCPPTILHLGDSLGFADALVERLEKSARPTVRAAYDGQSLESGNVYLIRDAHKHAVVDRTGSAMIRLVDGESIAGHRPSANLLLQSIASTMRGDVALGFLSGIGDDGVIGAGAISAAGGCVASVRAEEAKASELPLAAQTLARAAPLDLTDLGRTLLLHHATLAVAA